MGKNNIQKRSINRYYCNNCKILFSSQRRSKSLQKIIFLKQFYKRQILKNISAKYNHSLPYIRKQILEYELK